MPFSPNRRTRGKQSLIHLVSLGCAKNLVDSERILGRLADGGAIVGAPAEEADIIIVNTCGFIAPAKQESIETILELAEHKKAGRCGKLIVMGCLGQRYASLLRKQLPEADAVFGLDEEDAIVAACGLRVSPGRKTGRLLLTPEHTSYLRIADGCDNRCSYCAIPLIRGPFHSRQPGEILREARQLVADGTREINLIGQDTTMYGSDLGGGISLPMLLEKLSSIPRLRWVRLIYTHPAHFTDGLIEAYASIPSLCPYVDLPLQHLNDVILKRMGRKVTRKQVLDLIARLRELVPGVAIRTTFIVGFPGETRAQFNELVNLVKQVRFDHLGAFAYSKEEGTRAARMRQQISERAKALRLREIMLAQREIVARKNRAMRGKVVEVVVDGKAPGRRDMWIARSRVQAPDVDSITWVKGRNLRPGQFLKILVTGSRGYDLWARPAMRIR